MIDPDDMQPDPDLRRTETGCRRHIQILRNPRLQNCRPPSAKCSSACNESLSMRKPLLMLASLLAALPAVAAEPPEPVKVPPPPPISGPDTAAEDATAEPEVTIVQKGRRHHSEYRINGRLYMMKVKPKVGPEYYLIDDGGGNLHRTDAMGPKPSVPQWVLKRFEHSGRVLFAKTRPYPLASITESGNHDQPCPFYYRHAGRNVRPPQELFDRLAG